MARIECRLALESLESDTDGSDLKEALREAVAAKERFTLVSSSGYEFDISKVWDIHRIG